MGEHEPFEFDMAVSFAGEDREFVESFVEGVQAAGRTVFYDADHAAEMWGADLAEFFEDVFRKRSRFAVLFISRHYAAKMWTRHERRAALARGLTQPDPYVLPVRLDDTELPGLVPTVGYLDARQYGVNGVVQAAVTKITEGKPRPAEPISAVPRTEVERQRVIVERPPAWEYLMFAGELWHAMTELEPKYRDHQLRYAARTGEVLREGEFREYGLHATADVDRLIASLTSMMEVPVQEQAFGPPGADGDPELIRHLARRWTSIYEALIDWAARHRGLSAPTQYHRALDLLARLVDTPIDQYRAFVHELVHSFDWIPAARVSGRSDPVHVRVTLVLNLGDDDLRAFEEELHRMR